MKEVYFIEVNLICILFLSFISHKTATRRKSSLSQRFFTSSVVASELMCISDAIMGIIDGKIFWGSIVLNQFLNILYFILGTFVAVGWLFFVATKVSPKFSRKFMTVLSIPSIIVTILFVTNPVTNLGFRISEENVYQRGPLVWIHWIVVFFYLIYATGLSVFSSMKENNKIVRNMNLSYSLFGIFPIVALLIQIFIPDITSISVGIALGFLFYYTKSLENQISEDTLTGLNNRKQLEKYVGDLINKDAEIFIIMMDLNGFKEINDTFGHIAGDLALKDFSDALRMACRKWRGHYMLCRYGGDEFTVVGESHSDSNLQHFVELIRKYADEITGTKNREYKLSTSIGVMIGKCNKMEDFNRLYKEADKRMYEDKKWQKMQAKVNL